MEWEHFILDNPELAEKEHYVDPEYEEWERKAIEEDSKILIEESKPVEEDDWEDVEIDVTPVERGEHSDT